MANTETGEIRDFPDWMKDIQDGKVKKENLVPFEIGEVIEIKGVSFKVRAIKPSPTNMITLEGIPKSKR